MTAPSWLLLLIRVLGVVSHGVMTDHQGLIPRTGPTVQNPIELTGDARKVANRGCGGADNSMTNILVGGQPPITVVKSPGDSLVIAWTIAVAHDTAADGGPPDDTGIRIAVHYNADDSFENNVRRCVGGGVVGWSCGWLGF